MICEEGGVIRDVAGASPQDTFGGSPRSIVLNRAVMWQNRVSIALQGQFRRGRACCSAGGDCRVVLAAASPSSWRAASAASAVAARFSAAASCVSNSVRRPTMASMAWADAEPGGGPPLNCGGSNVRALIVLEVVEYDFFKLGTPA